MAMPHDDPWDQEVGDLYQRPLVGEERAREKVIARLRGEPAPRRTRWPAWWVDDGLIRVRPRYAAASLVAVLAIGAWGGAWWATSTRFRSPAAAVTAPMASRNGGEATKPVAVTFVFRAPGASRVSLVGDFNDWDPRATPLRRATLGDTWIVDVPLERGLHGYAFVIDDADWSADPAAPLAAEASFGQPHSVVVVGEGEPL